MIFYLSAFVFGLLGSFHCAGMCGPVAMALPVNNTSAANILTGRLLYNGGRIFTYASLGILAGIAGHVMMMAGFQRTLSIASGIIILLAAGVYSRKNFMSPVLAKYTGAIKNQFRKLFGQKSMTTLFMIGLVNGLLPCGFVYIALAASCAAGNVTGSVGYMALFGLGTVPMMLILSLAGNFFGLRFSRAVRKATPYIAVVVALFLIGRGILLQQPGACHH